MNRQALVIVLLLIAVLCLLLYELALAVVFVGFAVLALVWR